MPEGQIMISFCAMCKDQEEVMRAMEAFSRPMMGLALDGIPVMVMRPADDDD